ncbi:MAG: hypothetical protein ABI837_01855 [Acidobacteriota bacterium]
MNDRTTNSAELLIYKAATLLEEDDDVAGAELALREAIALSEISNRHVERIQATTFLGELLIQTEREEEARQRFQEVLALAPLFEGDPELIEDAVIAARGYLGVE